MSQIHSVPFGCDEDCSPPYSASTTPGPQGEAGEDGADGADGVSAFTFVANYDPAAQPVMPAEGASISVNVTSSTAFLQPNQSVFVAFWGTMKVFSVPTDTSVTLLNPAVAASGIYPDNAAAGTSLPAGSRITITGQQGAAGSTPANALLSTNDLSDVNSVPNARANLGLGNAAEATIGIANGELPPVDDAAGLTNGDFVQATGTGLRTRGAVDARSDLGLGTLSTQPANNVTITGGVINGTQVGNATPSSVAATTLAASGATALSGPVFTPTTAIQSLLAATPVNPNAAKIRVAGNGGAVTLTAVPTISNPAQDGQRLLILGTDGTNTVTFQDVSALAGSKLNLAGGANFVMGLGDALELIWDAALDGWFEISRSDN